MQPTTVVTLGNSSMPVDASSFEEAFGEYSEARGRAKRTERKLERIAAKQEVKAAKQAARAEKQVGRQEAKAAKQEAKAAKQEAKIARKAAVQQGRIAKRAAAQAARQEKRAAALESRGGRRLTRAELRARRRGTLAGPEVEMDETTMAETGDGYAPTEPIEAPETMGYSEETGYAPEETGYAPEDTGYAPEEGGYEEGGYEEEVVETPSGVYEEDNDDEFGAPEGTGEDSGFDGVMGAEDRFSELKDDAKDIKVSPMVADITKKIEWNKEFISRLRVKKAEIEGANGNPNDVNRQIAQRTQRILDLETELQQYASFEGDYSLADDYSDARGRRVRRRPNRAMKMRRLREINAGRARAYKMRRKFRGTPVAKGLNPEFAPQRIVIPARTSSATGQTGLNGLDLMDDYDAPDTRTVELSSSAEGAKKKINWVGIGIGAVVAVGAIWALRKYKVI